jgi:NAD(P)-dependent dehydrogenase (short-subunit alcohol dehydrogenase family)
VVTGASRGIGRGIAIRLAAEGARVVLAARDPDALAAVADEIRGQEGEALPVAADLTSESEVSRLFDRVESWAGSLEILINNAARVYGTDRHFLQVDADLWDDVIAANLRTLFLCSSRAARAMAERRTGSIVNISAASASRAHRMCVPYDASKGAVEAFTRALALDLAPFDIRVNAVAPGAIVVEAWGGLPREEMEKRAQVIPLGRLGEPADIAAAVAFLCSADAGYITGQVLSVEGGLLSQLRPPQVENWEPGTAWPSPPAEPVRS